MSFSLNVEELWVDKISRLLGFEFIYQKLNLPRKAKENAPYLYLAFFISVYTIIEAFSPSTDDYTFFELFYWILLLCVGLFFGVWAIKYLSSRYRKLKSKLGIGQIKWFRNIRGIVFSIALILLIGYILIMSGVIPTLGGEYIEPAIWSYTVPDLFIYFFYAFIFLPIVAEFIALILNIHLFLPLQVRREDIGLDFSDIKRVGGMELFGNIILRSIQIYYIGLTIYTIEQFVMRREIWVELGTCYLFGGGWFLGLILFFIPMLWIHKHMKEKKEEKLDDLDQKIRKNGSEDGGRLEVNPQKKEEMLGYVFNYLEHEHLYNISEYPLNFDRTISLASSAFIPLITEFILRLIA